MIETEQILGDEAIVEEIIRTKNTSLFEVIYDRYSNKVYRKCLSFTKSNAIAEDLTHDIFIIVFTKMANFKGRSKFSTWLYTITYNHCVDYSRKKSKSKETSKGDDLDHGETEDTEDYELELKETRLEQLQIILDNIPPADKMILLMKYQDDLSVKELAEQLQIGESAVKMRLKRAKEKVLDYHNEHFR